MHAASQHSIIITIVFVLPACNGIAQYLLLQHYRCSYSHQLCREQTAVAQQKASRNALIGPTLFDCVLRCEPNGVHHCHAHLFSSTFAEAWTVAVLLLVTSGAVVMLTTSVSLQWRVRRLSCYCDPLSIVML